MWHVRADSRSELPTYHVCLPPCGNIRKAGFQGLRWKHDAPRFADCPGQMNGEQRQSTWLFTYFMLLALRVSEQSGALQPGLAQPWQQPLHAF